MALAPGTRLGSYEIISALGAGGMGEVCRARDTKLDRDVAVKILPEAFAGDPERLARFQREAKTLASLNHRHIAAIYGFEESDDVTALVMELVEGEDLSKRIARGAIPLDEALPIARQIAEALEAAHEQGIVHRDLKPANIKIRADGTVKVLDFGLAKAIEPAVAGSSSASMSPTITTPAMTLAGAILGTAAYMAPEQARGRTVDRRADVWAFGCVLFEMLAGRPVFRGETVSEVLASVLKDDIDWNALPRETPPLVRRLLERCLQKDSRQRLRDVGDARLELEEVIAGGASPPAHAASVRSVRWQRLSPSRRARPGVPLSERTGVDARGQLVGKSRFNSSNQFTIMCRNRGAATVSGTGCGMRKLFPSMATANPGVSPRQRDVIVDLDGRIRDALLERPLRRDSLGERRPTLRPQASGHCAWVRLTRSAGLWSSCLAVMLTRPWRLSIAPACCRHARPLVFR